MLQFDCPYTFSGIPNVMNESLEEFAVSVLQQAAPEVLKSPMPLDVEKFMEYYLELEIEYKKLSYDKQVLGLTAFNSGFIQIINEITDEPEPLLVTAGTVVVDSSLLFKRNIPRLRFTQIHEGAHWMLHQKVFSNENWFFRNERYKNQYLAAKEGRIDYSRCQKERTDSERIERQADFFASTLLMNILAMRKAYANFFHFYNERPRRLFRNKTEDISFAHMLPKYIAKEFNVSERAALIRLEKLSAIVDKPNWGLR